jgi:hypothetical protein
MFPVFHSLFLTNKIIYKGPFGVIVLISDFMTDFAQILKD